MIGRCTRQGFATAAIGVVALAGAGLLASPAEGGWDAKLSQKVQATIQAFMKKDPALKTFFDKAHGYAVFPSIIKGGLGIGGASGKGQVFEGGRVIGSTRLTQGTIGFQAGGQSYSEIIFFQHKNALENFKNGNLKFAAQASAVAATAGAAANADYSEGVAVFTITKKGLMYEASIGGQHFSFKPN